MAPKKRLQIVVLGLGLGLAACAGESEPGAEGAGTQTQRLDERERLAPGASLGAAVAPRKVVFDESPRPVGLDLVRMFLLGFREGELDGEELPSGSQPSFFWASPLFPGEDWPISTSVSIPPGIELIAVRDVDGDGVPGPADRRSAVAVEAPLSEVQELTFLLNRGFLPEKEEKEESQEDVGWTYGSPNLSDESLESGARDFKLTVPEDTVLSPDLLKVGGSNSPSELSDEPPVPGAMTFLRRTPVDAVLSPVQIKVLPFETFTAGGRSSVLILGYPEATLNNDEPAKQVVPTFIWGFPEPSLDLPRVYEAIVPEDLALFLVVDLDDDGKMSAADYRSARFGAEDAEGGMLSVPLAVSLAAAFTVHVVPGELIRVKPGTLPVPVKLRVSASADYGIRWEGAAFVLGYPAGSGGATSRTTLPSFFWRQKSISADFPFPLSVPLAPGLEYVLVLDVNGDLVPSVGDAATESWIPPSKGSTSAAEVVQAYQGTILAFEDAATQGPGQAQPRVQVAGGGQPVSRQLSVPLGARVPSGWSSSLMIVGFPEDAVQDGQPSRGGRHQFFWESAETINKWPTLQQLELPEDLLYFAVLDVDGNQRPSPGDWSSPAFGAGEREALEVVIAGVFGPDDSVEDDGLAIDDDDDDDDDDSSDGQDFEDEDGEAAPAMFLPVGVDRSVLRRAVIDAQPRVPFLRRARILVAGFSADSIERGMPSPMSSPSYFWASGQLPIDWPLRAELRLPDVPGQTVYVILDLDDNGQPSPGDLSSAALANYEAPSGRVEPEFLLNNAYSVSVRLAPALAQ